MAVCRGLCEPPRFCERRNHKNTPLEPLCYQLGRNGDMVFHEGGAGVYITVDRAFKYFGVFLTAIAVFKSIFQGNTVVSVALLMQLPPEIYQPRVLAVLHQAIMKLPVTQMPLTYKFKVLVGNQPVLDKFQFPISRKKIAFPIVITIRQGQSQGANFDNFSGFADASKVIPAEFPHLEAALAFGCYQIVAQQARQCLAHSRGGNIELKPQTVDTKARARCQIAAKYLLTKLGFHGFDGRLLGWGGRFFDKRAL